MMRRWIVCLLLLAACRQEHVQRAATIDSDVQQWRDQRRARLTSDEGWLSLVGLYWLHDGPNDVTLPAHPPVTARLILQNGRVTLQPESQLGVKTPMVLRDDTDPSGPTIIRTGTLNF